MDQRLLKSTTVYCFIFFIIAVTGMFYYDANKIIVIADSSNNGSNQELDAVNSLQTQYSLVMENNKTYTNQIVIPLENAVKAESVYVENHYMDKEIWIGIRDGKSDFYSKKAIIGDMQKVKSGGYDIVDKVLWIKLSMDKVYEYESTMDNNKLLIKMKEPKDVYDKIIVLDAGHGGEDTGNHVLRTDEKDITLEILLLLQAKLKDSGIKVYYTRTADDFVSDEKRTEIANGVGADMAISIHTSYDEDTEKSGISTVYNGEYFIQDFCSIDLADILEKNVINETGAKVNGIVDAIETDVLVKDATVPVAQVNVGYLSNETDRENVKSGDYQNAIAEGIYNAIMQIYKEKLGK